MSSSNPVAENAAAMNALYGKTVLWIGQYCKDWTQAQFVDAAKQARALGFDTICPKRADGGVRWYGSPEQITAEAAAVRAEGCGYLPFIYLYGPRFPETGEAFPGERQVRAEAALAIELAKASGCNSVQLDMEAEYNGAVQCAELLASLLRPEPITVSVSTWADPRIQNWEGVAAALAPAVNAWTPQRYTLWLAKQPLPSEETCIQPGVDLTSEFGSNDPVAISTGAATVFVWEAQPAFNNPALARRVVDRTAPPIVKPAPTPEPPAPAPAPPAPAPPAPVYGTFQVKPWPQPGSSLSTIAGLVYGDESLWPIIAKANNLHEPYIIYAWQELKIPPKP